MLICANVFDCTLIELINLGKVFPIIGTGPDLNGIHKQRHNKAVE